MARYGEAEAELRHSIALDGASWTAHYDLGVLLYQAGDLARAEQSVRRSLELSRANAQVHVLLGLLLLRRGERTDGLEHLRFAARTSLLAKELLATLQEK